MDLFYTKNDIILFSVDTNRSDIFHDLILSAHHILTYTHGSWTNNIHIYIYLRVIELLLTKWRQIYFICVCHNRS